MRDCENCEYYKKSEEGYYSCSKWFCVQETGENYMSVREKNDEKN